jgi:hypothetical protein
VRSNVDSTIILQGQALVLLARANLVSLLTFEIVAVKEPGFLKPFEILFRSWTDISVDYVTGLPNRYVLVMVDRLTKMRHIITRKTLLRSK